MRFDLLILVALCILAHGWQGRINAGADALSIIGWTLNLLALVLIVLALVRPSP
jgi:hypothetical protein